MSVYVVRAFVKLRELLTSTKELARRLERSIRQSSATRSDFRMISCFGSQGR